MLLRFEPFRTVIGPEFWAALSKIKLDDLGLNQDLVRIHGFYEIGKMGNHEAEPHFHLDGESFSMEKTQGIHYLDGRLKIFNTLDDFKAFDKASFLKSKEAYDLDFFFIVYADLKRYKYYYHVCFPAPFSVEVPFEVEPINDTSTAPLTSVYEMKGDTLHVFDACSHEGVVGWNIRRLIVKYEPKILVGYRSDGLYRYNITKAPTMATPDLTMTGWERNAQGKIGPRLVDLSASLDPVKIAQDAASLNLKLIKWRLMPDLDLSAFASLKCLLVGAGTLGCNVTRALLAWGVTNITLLDNGRVSYSNPVRQSLFLHEDCLDGGKPKAEAAAARAMEICPYANVKGEQLNIPMPGHIISDEEGFIQNTEQLIELVQGHDAVFLLTDSRESRWLPAMLAAAYDKIVITVALGFDTFLAMRHGATGSKIGCYFCHEINSPTDTLSGRTLDQQCTVTRPGLSYLASATAVELLASLLQHPQQNRAPASAAVAPTDPTPTEASMLGLVPHQIRGFLSHFQNLILTGDKFDCCPCCSAKVIDVYRRDGINFIRRAIAEPDYLEAICGLQDLKNAEQSKVDEYLQDLDSSSDF